MTKQPNAYPLRIDEILSKKIKKLAKLDDRSYKGQIENILKNYVAQYERENGKIELDPDEQSPAPTGGVFLVENQGTL